MKIQDEEVKGMHLEDQDELECKSQDLDLDQKKINVQKQISQNTKTGGKANLADPI